MDAMRRPLCDSAKRGQLCIDDLCRTGGETLCGFDRDDYLDMLDEREGSDVFIDEDDTEG